MARVRLHYRMNFHFSFMCCCAGRGVIVRERHSHRATAHSACPSRGVLDGIQGPSDTSCRVRRRMTLYHTNYHENL